MSTGKGGGSKSGKPFLGDDDLKVELDAWDSMFDGLHEEASGTEMPREQVMEWPTPTPPPAQVVARPQDPDPTMEAQLTIDDPDLDAEMFGAEPELEAQLTLDAAPDSNADDDVGEPAEMTVERGYAEYRAPTHLSEPAVDPSETDFSDVGASGEPSALGDMLGSSSRGDDVVGEGPSARIEMVAPPRAATRAPTPTRPPTTLPEDDDDNDAVFTSASRPRAVSDISSGVGAAISPPLPASPSEPRRTAAIVRRASPNTPPLGTPTLNRNDKKTAPPPMAMPDFSDDTRIQEVGDIDARRYASKTQPPPIEDDEYEIEIDAESAPAVAIDVEAVSRPTRVAHTVRRLEPSKTAPIPLSTQAPQAPQADSPPAVVTESDLGLGTGGEDDFSDLSAVAPVRTHPPSSPPPMRAARSTVPPPSDAESTESSSSELDDALGTLDPEVTPDPDRLEVEANEASTDDGPGRTLAGMAPARAATTIEHYSRIKTPTSVPSLGSPDARPDPIAEIGARAVVELGDGRSSTTRLPRLQSSIPVEIEAPDPEPSVELEAAVIAWPEQVTPIASNTLDEAAARALEIYERELSTLDENSSTASLRIEAGRLCEQLGETDRARAHYDAALMADPRATGALRGLRRLARASGDLNEAVRHLDAEIAVAGALERRPLGHYRIDLLMATNDQDLARVAVGEILDQARSDVRALLAQLELAFLDGRAEEFGTALEQLAHAVTDPELRAAVQSARGALAAHQNDIKGAASYFAAAAESDPTSIASRIGAVRHAAAQADGELAASALLELARQLEPVDRITAAAAAVRAQQWATSGPTAAAAAALAIAAAPADPLVARLAAETAATSETPIVAAAAFAHWASTSASPAERAYAAARAAELDPTRGTELWSAAIEADPSDDYAAAQLRTAHVASDATEHAIAVDLEVASDPNRERARLRAAYGLIAQGQLDSAIDILQQGRAARPQSLALAEALGEALAAAGRWADRASLFGEIAADPGEQLDREVAQLRSALAWEEAVGAVASVEEGKEIDQEELRRCTAAALEAWEKVLEASPNAPEAHAAALVLAGRLGDRDVLAEVLARAQAADSSPWASASLALRRARLYSDDLGRAESILRDTAQGLDDPRRTVALIAVAARANDLADAASALEERANVLDDAKHVGEVGALRLRAAQLALDANDAARATQLLAKVETALPQLGVVPDLLAAARRRSGERQMSGSIPRVSLEAASNALSSGAAADAFARLVRDADLAATHGDGAGALATYQRALELRPGDPLATVPLIRLATLQGDPAAISDLAIAQLRASESAQDGVAKAVAYELLAHVDGELRGDAESAQVALESATQADPQRIDLMHRLERRYSHGEQLGELIRLRRAEVELIPAEHSKDRAALLADLASLATRDKRPEVEVADLHRRVLEFDARRRLALMNLEAIVRRAGFSEELAHLEEQIAIYFDGDAKTQAAFWTRAGETLAEIDKIDEAVLRFGKADAALPGHIPALEAWRQAALKGQLWIDVAEAANRQAAASEETHKAKLYHFAGVALMDKALVGEQATTAFKKALDADPKHRDSFLRLRILLEEDASHDELAVLLEQRLDVEPPGVAKTELHRALAELCRNFLSDRARAKEHYRAILDANPNDLRAHSAIADIAWELGDWQEAADALVSRARLERQPEVLKTLCFRLGLIYADRLVDVPMALKAFQRALTYQPDDEATLVRIADLAPQVGEWKLALGACERLVKNETEPDKRVSHLHRVARIFKDGFGDAKRAERALNLALDGAPTNDDALTQLVDFYKTANDTASLRIHLNRVAGQMRNRVAQNPKDGSAYRVISRAMVARQSAGIDGSRPIARAAAELAELLGEAAEPEKALLAAKPSADIGALLRPEADELLFPRSIPTELRQIFALLGDRVAKHVTVDLRPYGVTRGDRLRAKDNPAAALAQQVATGLGFGEIDVFVSQKQPFAMVAEPTSPVSLVLGSAVAHAGGETIRFASASALKLAQASLAIPARMSPDELGVLVVALLRVFVPDFPGDDVDADQVATQNQKLKRLIPSGMITELRPFAQAIDGARLDIRHLSRDLRVAGARAGLVGAGALLPGLRMLQGGEERDLSDFLADPMAQGLVAFALGDDYASLAR